MKQQIKNLYENFIRKFGYKPYTAICEVAFKDEPDSTFETYIKMSSAYDEENDDDIIYYANSLEELLSLTDKDNGTDFIVIEVKAFITGRDYNMLMNM